MASVNDTESQNCETYKNIATYVDPDRRYEFDHFEIRGQYPDPSSDNEAWMRNEESDVIIRRFSGMGYVATRDIVDGKPAYDYTPLGTENTTQRTMRIPKGTWYSWESIGEEPFVATATFTPAFNPDRYRVASERELVWEQS